MPTTRRQRPAPTRTASYAYYPRQWTAPFIDRRRKVGWDLYQLLGLERATRPAWRPSMGAI
jgi:hypothetical protein